MRFAFGDDSTRADGRCRHAPEWLVLGINNICNLKCQMCDVGLGDRSTVFWANLIGAHPQNMTLELLADILRQAKAFRPRPKIGLAFTEPLIHPRIIDFCCAVVSAGYYLQVVSNGTTLPRLAEPLVESGVHELVVSVDGPPAVHDRIRGRAGTFEKLYAGAERVNAAKARLKRAHPALHFSFTITDANYNHMLAFVQAVEPLKPAGIYISHLNFISEQMASAHNAQYDGDLRVVRSNLGSIEPERIPLDALWDELQRVKAYARAHPSLSLPITPDAAQPSILRTYYQDHLRFVGGRRCTDPWQLMMIQTDGTVIPAHGRCYNFPLGNLQQQPLAEIWNNERFRQFRQTLYRAGGTLPACARCCGVIGKPVAEVHH
jgi:MoaA/NifB/PqqE/SkfB family radical SAM enzyme